MLIPAGMFISPRKEEKKGESFVSRIHEFILTFFFFLAFKKMIAVLCDMIIIIIIQFGVYKALLLINWTSVFETITLNAAPVNADVSSWSTDRTCGLRELSSGVLLVAFSVCYIVTVGTHRTIAGRSYFMPAATANSYFI